MMSSTTSSSIARHVGPERRAGERAQAVDRLPRREEREVGAEQQLVRHAVLGRRDERVVEQPAPRDERRDVGVDVAGGGARPAIASSNHGWPMCAITIFSRGWRSAISSSSAGPGLEQRAGARERRALVDQHRQPEPLERRAHARNSGPERVDVLVDRRELAAARGRGRRKRSSSSTRAGVVRVDGAEADRAAPGRARRTRRRSRSARRSPAAGALNASTIATSTSASASRWWSSSVPPSTTSGHASRASDANFSEMCAGYSPTCVWTSTIMRRMKITEIATLPIAVGGHAGRYGGGYSEGYAEDYRFAVIIVLVRTDEGLTGIGEASLAGQGRAVLGVLDHFSEVLVGQDPAQIEHWWTRARARHVLVERPGDHERGRRDRHRAVGSQGQGARRAGLRAARRADARPRPRLRPPARARRPTS